MTTTDTALEHAWSWDTVDRQVRDRVAESVFHATDKLDVGMLGNLDQVSLVPSLTRLGTFWALHPAKVFEQTTKYYQQSLRASMAFAARSVGAAVDGPAEPARDKRFADPAWTDNPYFWWVRQRYLLLNEAASALVNDRRPASCRPRTWPRRST